MSAARGPGGPRGEPGPAARERLQTTGPHPRAARVRRRREFLRIQKYGVRVHSDAFVVVAACEPTSVRARLGCAVSKKVGDAPTRARLRRLLREIFRRLAASLPAVDLVVIAKPGAAALAVAGLGPTADELVPALEKAARRALERSTSRGRSRR